MNNVADWLQYGSFGLLAAVLLGGGIALFKIVNPIIVKIADGIINYLNKQAETLSKITLVLADISNVVSSISAQQQVLVDQNRQLQRAIDDHIAVMAEYNRQSNAAHRVIDQKINCIEEKLNTIGEKSR